MRQNGYQDFTREVTLQPGEKQLVTVTMVKAPGYVMPAVTSEIKMSINPDRAAVFLDGQFVGHAAEFGGIGKSLIVAPGHRKISITLPGYNTFNTEIDLAPNQKFVLKTDLTQVRQPGHAGAEVGFPWIGICDSPSSDYPTEAQPVSPIAILYRFLRSLTLLRSTLFLGGTVCDDHGAHSGPYPLQLSMPGNLNRRIFAKARP